MKLRVIQKKNIKLENMKLAKFKLVNLE